MRAVTLSQKEGVPTASYPVPPGLEVDNFNMPLMDLAPVWARIEAHIAYRWTPRPVTWIVEGQGVWTPPLTPATVTKGESWVDGADWGVITLQGSPYGHFLPHRGPFRVTATVGAGETPPEVLEAARRLATYSAEIGEYTMLKGRAGETSHTTDLGSVSNSSHKPNNWAARALINSGAADLLRPYRKAASYVAV